MDIINLIELLKPQDHLVTIKVVTESSFGDEIGKFAVAILPAAISLAALSFSYVQFKKNLQNQISQFKEANSQQIKFAELNAKITTEVEIIKFRCDEIRKISADCISFATDVQKIFALERDYKEFHDKGSMKLAEYKQKMAEAHEKKMKSFDDMFASQTMLMTYLDVEKDKHFLNALNDLCSIKKLSAYTSAEMGYARGDFVAHCRLYISIKDSEIQNIIKLSSH